MAVLTVTEYARAMKIEGFGNAPVADVLSKVVAYQIAVGAGSVAAATAINPGTTLLRLDTDVAVRYEVGAAASVTASATTSPRLGTDGVEYVGIAPGSTSYKVACING